MKFLLILLSFVFVDNGCSESKINQDAISIEYTAHSRGPYKYIKINKKRIALVNKREAKPITKMCSATDWKKLMGLLKNVDIENIPNLKAPSEKRFFDGASIAKLKIMYNGTAYETPSFDHGNPHQDISEFVKQILSISENIE